MSLFKAIRYGKEKRKEWSFCKRVDKRCRNHGGCLWCLSNRLHKFQKALTKAEFSEEESYEENNSI
ncbi:MAG: hypothetical protein IJX99_01080 [Clostridia bacterium]|nr:hypothetical protein [Clostridia bacterium]MBQ8298464.1 hypothetical protein [Clostridia bacterium]